VVQRLMNRLSHLKLRSGLSDTAPGGVIMASKDNILQRNFKADQPNEKWVTDVTEFAVNGRKLYFHQSLISSITK
jgi:putative transposase